METKNNKAVRLNVDEETKRFLETITDRLSDSMIDFVKREDLRRNLEDLETRVFGIFGKSGDTLMKAMEFISQRLETLETISDDSKRLLVEYDARLVGGLERGSVAIMQRIKNATENNNAIMGKAEVIDKKTNKMLDRLEALESRISELANQIARLNRPWWQKLSGY